LPVSQKIRDSIANPAITVQEMIEQYGTDYSYSEIVYQNVWYANDGDKLLTYSYSSGITFNFFERQDDRIVFLQFWDIKSDDFEIPFNIKLGLTTVEVRNILGDSPLNEHNGDLHYGIEMDSLVFIFDNDKLNRIYGIESNSFPKPWPLDNCS